MTSNPKCIDCVEVQKSPNKCICNDEIRCGSCKDCSWCINEHQNGRCVSNKHYNRKNCPYSFTNIPKNKKWRKQEYTTDVIKILGRTPTVFNLSLYKIIFIVLVLILLIILLITYLYHTKKNNSI